MLIQFKWCKFSDLSLEQLYEVLQLRAQTFVVEQQCTYLDPDGEDQQAMHLLGMHGDRIVCYLRLFLPNDQRDYLKFGRVITSSSARGNGIGKQLMNELIAYASKNYPNLPIRCQAQAHLERFYQGFAFTTVSAVYDDVGIPHIDMIRN